VDERTADAILAPADDLRRAAAEREALYRIRRTTSTIIQTDLYLTGPPYPGPVRRLGETPDTR
jgi:hypothetical protein